MLAQKIPSVSLQKQGSRFGASSAGMETRTDSVCSVSNVQHLLWLLCLPVWVSLWHVRGWKKGIIQQ